MKYYKLNELFYRVNQKNLLIEVLMSYPLIWKKSGIYDSEQKLLSDGALEVTEDDVNHNRG